MTATKVKLEKLTNILSGFAFESKLFSNEKGKPLIRIRDVVRGYSETYYTGAFDSSYLVNTNDILIGMDGEFNSARWKGEPALLNQRVCKIATANSKTLDNNYLYWFLPAKLKEIEDRTPFVTVKHLSVKDIRNIEIPLPTLSVQKQIADTLDKVDVLRRKDHQLQEKYDELAQSIFYEMFGDPVRNEKGWETADFREIGKLDRGVSKHRPRNAPELLNGPYPLIQTGDIANSGGYITKYTQTYSEQGLKQSKLWKSGTLCITIAANIAKTGILTFDACFPDSVVGFVPNERSTVNFVRYWLMHLQETLEATAPESAQKNINLEMLRMLTIPVPPIELQIQFEHKLRLVMTSFAKAEMSAGQSDELFSSLLSNFFR